MTRNMRKAVLAALALSVSFTAAAVIKRASEVEYTYFDEQGQYIGSLTLPCEGPIIREGNTTDYAYYTVTSFSCDLAGPEPEPNQPEFPGPFGLMRR